MSYLFGSILAVEKDDIVMMAILTVIVVLSVHIWYREILAVSYDREYASLRGIPDKKIYTAILVLASLTVVVAIKVVGLILVIALMSVPTYISERISGSLYSMMMLSALLSVLFTIGGLILSYRFDLTSGACIILLSTVAMALFTIAEKIFGKRGSSIS
jgi:zinc transport system permease protein